MRQKIQIVKDADGRKTVFIHDQIFKGKRTISWQEVEAYLKLFVGDVCVVESTDDEIYIGAKLPDEYAHSEYTETLRGNKLKAKANAVQGIHEMIEIAENKRFVQNFKKKHHNDAKNGWYRYDTRFALPIYNSENEIERYNVFNATLIVNHGKNNRLYLYDVINIKKGTEQPTLELNQVVNDPVPSQ